MAMACPPSPFRREFRHCCLAISKIRKSTGDNTLVCSIMTRFLSQISPAADWSLSVFCSNQHRSTMWYISNYYKYLNSKTVALHTNSKYAI